MLHSFIPCKFGILGFLFSALSPSSPIYTSSDYPGPAVPRPDLTSLVYLNSSSNGMNHKPPPPLPPFKLLCSDARYRLDRLQLAPATHEYRIVRHDYPLSSRLGGLCTRWLVIAGLIASLVRAAPNDQPWFKEFTWGLQCHEWVRNNLPCSVPLSRVNQSPVEIARPLTVFLLLDDAHHRCPAGSFLPYSYFASTL